MNTATTLTAGEIAELRERARCDGRFIDPHRLRESESLARETTRQWRAAILGHDNWNRRRARWEDTLTLLYAREAEPNPPAPEPPAADELPDEAANADGADPRQRWWTQARPLLPVAACVRHNYKSARHLGHYVQGADHIVLLEPLKVGRLLRRRGDALCETPSRADNYYFSDWDDRHLDELWREPTCRACIRKAAKLTGTTYPGPA